ncbi:MAG: class III poly(R)-hydroxyalkanoic acid synthase subunit PhaC [Deltaproteobacteria bacterium]
MRTFEDQLTINFAERWIDTASKLVRGFDNLLSMGEIESDRTDKDLVYQEDKMKLYQYRKTTQNVCQVPLLICYALVNRQYMMDLEPDRSLIRNLLDLGLDIYIIDWGYPGKMDRFIEFDDYIDLYLSDAVDFVRRETGVPAVNLLGVCQGGTMAAIYTALYPEKIRNLVAMVAPFDFSVDDGLLNLWAKYLDTDLVEESIGNIPGDLLNVAFLMLKPFSLMMDKYVGFLETIDNPKNVDSFLRMEKWIFDSPDQAGAAWKKFVKELYQDNKLIKGQLTINGRKVDLRNITHPVLNIYAEKDHLVPPSSSQPLEKYVGSRDITTAAFPVGHIGIYVSSKTQKQLPPLVAKWLWERSGECDAQREVG